jgi:hypothetical protein
MEGVINSGTNPDLGLIFISGYKKMGVFLNGFL